MKNIFFLFFVSILSICVADEGTNAITWQANGGRFGDNLLSYSRAKYLSYLYNIAVLYQSFPYADELLLHENELLYTPESLSDFSTVIHLLKSLSAFNPESANTLYVCHWKADITINWLDTVFVAVLKKNIAPRYEIEKTVIPEGVISIAAHVRNGGTFAADTPQEKDRCPLRFVPEEFFIAQIERIAEMFPDENLYVHIFTDHPNPAKLVKKFKAALNNPRITFGCRTEGNAHNAYVLEDFFSMMDFDCLIRPGSHYTRFVQRLGSNKVVIYPESVKEINGQKVINTIKVKTRKSADKKWKTQSVVIA